MLEAPKDLGHLDAIKEYILVFSAPWCKPCYPAKRIVDEVSQKTGVVAYVVDVDKRPDDADLYGIFWLPTVLVFRDGEIVQGFKGSVDAERLKEVLK